MEGKTLCRSRSSCLPISVSPVTYDACQLPRVWLEIPWQTGHDSISKARHVVDPGFSLGNGAGAAEIDMK